MGIRTSDKQAIEELPRRSFPSFTRGPFDFDLTTNLGEEPGQKNGSTS